MTVERHPARYGKPIARLGLIKAVFIIVFTFLLFLLIHSMVHHRFFSGGPYTNRNSASAP